MRIFQVHNFYQQPGGEDQVLAAEHELLSGFGHSVEQFTAHNDAIKQMAGIDIALRTVWNPRMYRETRRRLRAFRPDVVHAHNVFPYVSPALYDAAWAEGVPVVQTLHNYRLVCPKATLYRSGRVCEDCVGKAIDYPAFFHACYRASRAATAPVCGMLTLGQARGTWRKRIQTYIALTEFSRGVFVRGGLPASRIQIKPNFLARDPGPGEGSGGYALFAGRLAEEKGIRTLLAAWERIPQIPLKIAGDGPLSAWVRERAANLRQVEQLGHVPREQALRLMREAAALVVPSEWYEAMPMTVVEAMACGTPVIASDLGSLAELVQDGRNGFRFPVGDARALAQAVERAFASDTLRAHCRRAFEARYTAARNYDLLSKIYQDAIREYQVERSAR